ncbi:hypothetical protein OG474_18795 [Kribbella sp. NBC_01505]|uniref:hypothetical protein n=1 Tax=Kribbella sp. NBC_01505 TaxID=2903580 RepID=UPI00386438EE
MNQKVVLMSTKRLTPEYFDTVRADLGGGDDLVLDVIGWLPPEDLVDDKVNTFTLIGPGQMPTIADRVENHDDGEEFDEAPDAVLAPEAVSGPRPKQKPQPTPPSAVRVKKAAGWRVRRVQQSAVRVAMKIGPVRIVRVSRMSKKISNAYWKRVQARPDVRDFLAQADVVIALDGNAVWAGWNLGQERPDRPVVLGLPAARRELDQLKVPAGH